MLRIMRWGNSFALRLPKVFTEALRLNEGSMVKVKIEKNRLIVEPSGEATLDEMLACITPETFTRR